MVPRFRIQFDMGDLNQSVIDEWLRFVVNKNVEILELDLQNGRKACTIFPSYNFPLNLSNAKVVELASLRKLYLNNVVVRNGVVEKLLTTSPLLEFISIHRCNGLTQIRVGGQGVINLKHLEIVNCFGDLSIHLNDCDLVSFMYKGILTDLEFANLPNLKEFNIRHDRVGFENYVLSQLSSCVSSLEALSFSVNGMITENLLSIPRLPNLKKLTLTIDTMEDGHLLNHLVSSIREACPNLETFIIKLGWYSPFERRVLKARSSANIPPFESLKVFKMLGYYGRSVDYELAAYVIHNAVALEKVVIDPRCQDLITIDRHKVHRNVLLKKDFARSSAKRQLESLVARKSPGAKFVIL
ncbi:hypothetical protein QVD17_16250 [Tagetes erecta]|uniref:At1g61320/AtMIF1 LRR domain-containing protein n=1 Tax=Tagetes erecta TaxID=13708 RepID=A0AAD8P0C8_TARER|nr:hypothetical protein QVD17_16250 [Tagetes erecta]